MLRILATVLAVGSLTVATVAPAATAPASPPSATGTVCKVRTARTIHGVQVRTAPRTSAPSRGVLKADRFIEIRGPESIREGSWIPVTYQGRAGWIARRDPRTGRTLSEGPWIELRQCSAPAINRALSARERAKIKRLEL